MLYFLFHCKDFTLFLLLMLNPTFLVNDEENIMKTASLHTLVCGRYVDLDRTRHISGRLRNLLMSVF